MEVNMTPWKMISSILRSTWFTDSLVIFEIYNSNSLSENTYKLVLLRFAVLRRIFHFSHPHVWKWLVLDITITNLVLFMVWKFRTKMTSIFIRSTHLIWSMIGTPSLESRITIYNNYFNIPSKKTPCEILPANNENKMISYREPS